MLEAHRARYFHVVERFNIVRRSEAEHMKNGMASVRVQAKAHTGTPQVRPRDPVELMSFT